ncbi:hypothetical protein [Leptolyngbya sp. 7M]|uniref:hypothetical protein n=1 Tax=Leptolyngbya sp. 7M TaxID=2812896 RepID=UPI001B8BC8C8|nr:hypothetical protein [Leptolyngbya sp. 7M]QYO67161.1 hypothetical protein JVX88_10350 [Leptolyngbya sp. 7M]
MLKSSILLIGLIISSCGVVTTASNDSPTQVSSRQGMTASELAQFAVAHDEPFEDKPTVFTTNHNKACGLEIPVKLVETMDLGNNRLAGITYYQDCALAVFTYFEMMRGNLDSISPFVEIAAGRSVQYSNWGPTTEPGCGIAPDPNPAIPGCELSSENLRFIAQAIEQSEP